MKMKIVVDDFSGNRSLTENRFNGDRFGLGQDIGIENKTLLRMLRNPMKTSRKITESKITCRFIGLKTFKFYGE
jgi:hypothetical protein